MWRPWGWGSVCGPEDLGHLAGFVVRRDLSRLPFLPHGDEREPQQHGVGHAQDCVDEASHVVVLLSPLGGHQTLHQHQPADRSQHRQADHEEAEDYADRRASFPCSRANPHPGVPSLPPHSTARVTHRPDGPAAHMGDVPRSGGGADLLGHQETLWAARLETPRGGPGAKPRTSIHRSS